MPPGGPGSAGYDGVDAATGYSEALLGHRAQSTGELVALYGALLAHGTDADAKGVASMIPGLEPTQVTVAMRALEGSCRLRRANERVAEFQSRIPIAALWGNGDKASADMVIASPAQAGSSIRENYENDDLSGKDKFRIIHPNTYWQAGIEHGVKIGLGNMEYELINV